MILERTDLFGNTTREVINEGKKTSKLQFEPEIIKIESFTQKGVFYEIDKKNYTCTCPAFMRRPKQFCKHLKKLIGLGDDEPEVGVSTSLLKSNFQKCVRLGKVEDALKSAKLWAKKEPVDFLRRLVVVLVEECVLHPKLGEVSDLLKNINKKKTLDKGDMDLVLSIIKDVVECEYREFWDTHHPEKDAVDKFFHTNIYETTLHTLGMEERKLVESINFRSKLGGMQGDMRMLGFLTRLWLYRFSTKLWSANSLNKYFKFNSVDSDKISDEVKPENITLSAVDFHCSPLLRILLKKDWIIGLIQTNFVCNTNEELELRLKDVVWRCRSSINTKKTISTDEVFDWLNFANEKPYHYELTYKQKYLDIYSKLEIQINNISQWYIQKQFENK